MSDWEDARTEGTIALTIPEELPAISDNGYLSRMFTSLLRAFISVTPRLKYGGKIIISQPSHNDLPIQIIREFEAPKSDSLNIETVIWDTLDISLAVLILRSHRSDLEVHAKDTHITFEFSLPIWQENS
jgi:hypothetical protein